MRDDDDGAALLLDDLDGAAQVGFNLLLYSLQAVSVGVAYFGLRRAREGALPDELLRVFE